MIRFSTALNGWSRLALLASVGVSTLAVSGCLKAEAKTPGPAPVVLSVPEPPDRLTIPVPAEPPPPPPPVTEKPAAPNTPATRPNPPKPAPVSTPPATSTEPPPPSTVQTGEQAAQETRARERLKKAEDDLGRVKRDTLSKEAKSQYDSADLFIRRTRSALKAQNYVYAEFCADKAATLAALLVKG